MLRCPAQRGLEAPGGWASRAVTDRVVCGTSFHWGKQMTGNKSVSRGRSRKNDEAPELTDAWFAKADLYKGGKLVRKGRPKGSGTKRSAAK